MVEGIRLLEAFVTAPLGLYSDLKMLRESLPYPEAANLVREEMVERRTAYGGLTDSPNDLILTTISSVRVSLDILQTLGNDPDVSRLRPGWTEQARRVLDRTQQKVERDIEAQR
jgi:hypothetical protein